MEGILKKKISILRGYQDQWFVLTKKGDLEYYKKQPENTEENALGKISIMLANIIIGKDDVKFKITTNTGETYILKGKCAKDRELWIDAIKLKQQELKQKASEPSIGKGSKSTKEPTQSIKKRMKVVEKALRHSMSDPLTTQSDVLHQECQQQSIDTNKNTTSPAKQKCLLVAAIDFGSSASGCAFSFYTSYKLDPLDIQTEPIGGKDGMTYKAPTAVLLDPEGKFRAFGKKAREDYANLVTDGKHRGWYFFDRFKMQLYTTKSLHKDMTLKDIEGKEMKASDVFAICIEYIKDTVFKRASQASSGLKEDDVHWMLTVPAIWNDSARQFMISAAEKAGISRHLLSLVLEPEAAAIFCKHIEVQKKNTGQTTDLGVFEAGSQFLVVDLGGGTVDITCNEVLPTGQLREIYNASGGPWGGNMINQRIWKLIRKLFTNEVVDKLIAEDTDSHLDMLKNIEEEKMKMSHNKKCVIKLPFGLQDAEIIETEGVQMKGAKLIINTNIIVPIFESSTKQVCAHLLKVLERSETKHVKALLLVGGYSACDKLKETIRQTFSKYTIICPVHPEMIVLKGAVIMGHMACMTRPIVGRLARFHYGLAAPHGLKIIAKSDNDDPIIPHHKLGFYPLITKGQQIEVGERIVEYSFIVTDDKIQEARIDILMSESEELPKDLSDDASSKIGQIEVRIPSFKISTVINIVISCDETEFKVTAVIDDTGHKFSAVCSFLQ